MSSITGYVWISGVPWSGWMNMYRHKVQDLNSGIVTPMSNYLLGTAYVGPDRRFQIEYSWDAGSSLTAVAGSASSSSGGGSYYRGRRAIVGGSSPSRMQGGPATGGLAANRVGSSLQQFGSSRPYAAYVGRWCWFEFPLEVPDGDVPAVYVTRVNINAFPNTYVEWTEDDAYSDEIMDVSWEIRNDGHLWIERGLAGG